MLPSAASRGSFWLASFAVHGAVFVAAGHAPPAQTQPAIEAPPETAVEVTPEPAVLIPAPDAPPPVTRSAAFVPPSPPTHTHPYPVPPDHDAHPHDPSLVHLSPLAVLPAAPAPVLAAPAADPAPPRFTMVIDSRVAPGSGVVVAAGREGAHVAGAEPGSDAFPLPEAQVTSGARCAGLVDPKDYPERARAEGVEADVGLEFVVTSSGVPVDVRVVRPAGYGLDEAAMAAMRAARCTPAQYDGKPVAVRMRWTVQYRLH